MLLSKNDPDTFVDVVNECREAIYLYLTGGEPFLNEYIFDMIEYAHSRKMRVTASTNGSILNDKINRIVDSPLSGLNISLDADNPSDFYAQHLSGAQRLSSGNTLICYGPPGIFFEITPEKATIWEYINNYPDPNKNNVFKIIHYPPEYPGLGYLSYQPNKPSIPNGPSKGEIGVKYTYSTSTTDPQSDQVYYLFDWGDGTESGWLGPFPSGETIEANHTWTKQKIYKIKVKAKDIIGYESVWSDKLAISIPRIKISSNNLLLRLFRQLFRI